jgi:hypothetical protein
MGPNEAPLLGRYGLDSAHGAETFAISCAAPFPTAPLCLGRAASASGRSGTTPDGSAAPAPCKRSTYSPRSRSSLATPERAAARPPN